MFISTEEEQISLHSEDAKGSLNLKSSPMGSNPDSLDALPPISDLSDSLPPLPSIYTDVNVVPEHQKTELEQSISNLEGELAQLRLKKRSLDEKRREALNKILDIKGSIRVFCRVKSFRFMDRRIREPILIGLEKIAVRSAGSKKEFGFDKVFNQEASQEDVFVEVEPILRSALDGHNVCVLAYGQTGTGKTFTMDGTGDQPGIVPRALEELFRQASLDNSTSVSFSMSMLEVYMGNLRDLLAPKPVCKAYEAVTKCNLNIQTDSKGMVEVEGLTEVLIPDFEKARCWYNKGRRVRSTSWTNVNEASSRSHCLTRITIFRHGDTLNAKREVSKIWLVDLGGSERVLKTGATGQTLDEGRAINLSLSALADVIAALRRKRGHVPFRNSKLTQILKDSLGDGSKVLMVVHVSPCEEDVGETICSLNFAKRARGIESNRELPEDLKKQREKKMAQLEEEMREADVECQKVRNQKQEVEFLLSEKKKLLSTTYQPIKAEEMIPSSPKENLKEAVATPKVSDKIIRRNTGNSLPRFMISTVASRQRQSAAERDIGTKSKSLRTGSKSSALFSGSQSLSFIDSRLKVILQSSNKKPRYSEANGHTTESPRSVVLDSKTTSMPRSKMVTSSDPNLRVKLSYHRRRMSDFI
ncbi:kinesin-like protein KIN-14U [Pistacia vera]|uniref:kinesin-like protein KIN-14U n=1 Tax=Pistacia vera TaxID=55513 RepID=UPI0012638435|nr:kinesin-like protein KIN-14U [Pistacia vera]